MGPAFRLEFLGFGLIAVCYGFARFAFALFRPQIDRQLSLVDCLRRLRPAAAPSGFSKRV